ncbi:AmmeMemoRadiSam system radical SAM enzyme [Desulfurivibrio dismutans]|uniref:AmmeMemoRadiSam system radical SAM enzyme n=1 Tax=Desulfurivibrio dismutans TaxID=1398908 RepID=UPI0023DC0211|nr:AmmeMemoRadiSam system radical SAM enzyme [Desulfurivibrio alkaliphilus]MDF1613702.1 AmmeMemoRadiSam system radical SAM enzyme [Desulfurivibrio alkaliphilus]
MREAMFYQVEKGATVVCGLCSHHCRIKDGRRGLCGVRENRAGKLYSLVYGRLVAENFDPIEKKPLFHFLPGSRSYSISTVGCNFRCQHCQNYHISQYPHLHRGEIAGQERTAAEVVAAAAAGGCQSISYTYVEPTIFYEFAYDCAVLAQKRGIKNVFVSNGYMTKEVSRQLAGVLDGINIDLKAYSDQFYRQVCQARLQPVLDNIRRLHQLGVWVELTTLLIPGLNDSDQELQNIARFIKETDPGIPWHVTAFYPTHEMLDRPPTPTASLERAREIGLATGLRFVYEGNIPGSGGENTYCPACGTLLIKRHGFRIDDNLLAADTCPACGEKIEGVWK